MLKYKVTSFSEGKNGGQITVTVGEGKNRRSFTRHLHRQSGALMGLNIDERAIPLNKVYEAELATAKSDLASAEAMLKILEKKTEEVSKAPEGDIVTESMLLATYVFLEEQLELAQDLVCTTKTIVDDAKTKFDIVRRELPLEVEFIGPGLTF